MKNLMALLSLVSVVLMAQGSLAQDQWGRDNNDRGGHGGPQFPHNPPAPRPLPPPPPPAPPQPPHHPAPMPPPNHYGDLVSIYRVYNGVDHMMTTNPSEGAPSYHFELEAFRLFREAGRDRQALFRCVTRQGNDHFVSTQGNCEGQIVDFMMGYAQSFPNASAPRTIYRCATSRDHLITMDVNECTRNGYRVEGSLGYVP